MNDAQIKEKIAEGAVLSRIIMELQGGPKEHIEKTMEMVIEKIKSEITTLKVDSNSVEELEDHEGVFSTFTELELLFDDMEAFISFCFDYTPSSVEVLEPEEMNFNSNILSNFMNDVVTRLHQNTNLVKQMTMENKALKYNSSAFLRNLITLSLSAKSRNSEELSKMVGIKVESLEPILKQLVEKEQLVLDADKYSLPAKK